MPAVSVFSWVQQLCLQGETYDKMSLWRDAGSAAPVTAGLFYDMATNTMEDEHCLKMASPKACLTVWKGCQVCRQPHKKLAKGDCGTSSRWAASGNEGMWVLSEPVEAGWDVPPAQWYSAKLWPSCCGRRGKVNRAELHQHLPDAVLPAINLVQLLVQHCAGNYCKVYQATGKQHWKTPDAPFWVLHAPFPLKLIEII